MNHRIAIVFGSTGLVGSHLQEELINSEYYSKIKTFVRKSSGVTNNKVEEFLIDFDEPEVFSKNITGEDIFICLGTTLKKAGSIKKMEEIDRDLPIIIATIAKVNGVKKVAAVSSIGASTSSKNYYLRIKGEMEEGIIKLNFENYAIVRPSMLAGERKEKRTGEVIANVVMKIFNPVFIGKMEKYRSIYATDVAKSMIAILQKGQSKSIYESDELQRIADQY
jgi:uncharacterized protein YbjT (DUF2867 family)